MSDPLFVVGVIAAFIAGFASCVMVIGAVLGRWMWRQFKKQTDQKTARSAAGGGLPTPNPPFTTKH